MSSPWVKILPPQKHVDLYGAQESRANLNKGVGLGVIPKRPTEMERLRDGPSAWAEFRASRGKPGTTRENAIREGKMIERMYPGWPIQSSKPEDQGHTLFDLLQKSLGISKQKLLPVQPNEKYPNHINNTVHMPQDWLDAPDRSLGLGVLFHELRHGRDKNVHKFLRQDKQFETNPEGDQIGHLYQGIGDRPAAEAMEAQDLIRNYGAPPSWVYKDYPWIKGSPWKINPPERP